MESLLQKAKKVKDGLMGGQNQQVAEVSPVKDELQQVKEKASVVLEKANSTIVKAGFSNRVLKSYLEKLHGKEMEAGENYDIRQYWQLQKPISRLEAARTTNKTLSMVAKELEAEASAAEMTEEGLKDTVAVQDAFIEAGGAFLELMKNQPSLVDKYKQNQIVISGLLEQIDRTMEKIQNMSEISTSDEDVPPEVVAKFKEFRKGLGLPP